MTKWWWIIALLLAFSAPGDGTLRAAEDPATVPAAVQTPQTATLLPAAATTNFGPTLPIALPGYEIVIRGIDPSVLVAVEYIPELAPGPWACSRLEVCVDLTPGAVPQVGQEPLRGTAPGQLLLAAVSGSMDRLATMTKVGISVAFSFKS